MVMQTAQAPQAPATPGHPVVVVHDAPGAGTFTIPTPMSARELSALKAQREELSNQLQSVDSRRSKLLSQLRQARDPSAVSGLEDRLALLDKRQLQLESDLATTGQQLSSVPAGLGAGAGGPPLFAGLGSGQGVAVSIVSVIFIFGPPAGGERGRPRHVRWTGIGPGRGDLDRLDHFHLGSAGGRLCAYALETAGSTSAPAGGVYGDRSAPRTTGGRGRLDRDRDRANLRRAAIRDEAFVGGTACACARRGATQARSRPFGPIRSEVALTKRA